MALALVNLTHHLNGVCLDLWVCCPWYISLTAFAASLEQLTMVPPPGRPSLTPFNAMTAPQWRRDGGAAVVAPAHGATAKIWFPNCLAWLLVKSWQVLASQIDKVKHMALCCHVVLRGTLSMANT